MSRALVIKGADFSINRVTIVDFVSNPCTSITLDKYELSLTSIGATDTLVASVLPEDTTDRIVWSSNNEDVVTVVNGVVEAVGLGSAIVTATCGEMYATCGVNVTVVPEYLVVGAFHPGRVSSSSTAAMANRVSTDVTAGTKNGIIAQVSSDPTRLSINRETESELPWRFVPIPIPAGAVKIRITSQLYKNGSLLSLRTNMLWFDSKHKETQYNYGVKCVGGKNSADNYDQDTHAPSWTITIPTDLQGLDSFAIGLQMSDWSLAYHEYPNDSFVVEFLSSSDE